MKKLGLAVFCGSILIFGTCYPKIAEEILKFTKKKIVFKNKTSEEVVLNLPNEYKLDAGEKKSCDVGYKLYYPKYKNISIAWIKPKKQRECQMNCRVKYPPERGPITMAGVTFTPHPRFEGCADKCKQDYPKLELDEAARKDLKKRLKDAKENARFEIIIEEDKLKVTGPK